MQSGGRGGYENIQETPRKVTKRTGREHRKPQKGQNPEKGRRNGPRKPWEPSEICSGRGSGPRKAPGNRESGGSRSGSAAAGAHGRGDQAAGPGMCSGSVAGSSGKGCSWRQDPPGSWGGFGDLSGQRQRPGSPRGSGQKIIDNITPRKAAPVSLGVFGDLFRPRQRVQWSPQEIGKRRKPVRIGGGRAWNVLRICGKSSGKVVKNFIDNITPWEADRRKPGSWGAFGDLSGQRQRPREAPEGRSSGKVAEKRTGRSQRTRQEAQAGGPGRHSGGGKAAEAGSSGETAEYKTQ